ncbi:hypothetical protein LWE61_01145 [Sphingobium sufflavum]|jgi:hypothetical protein|uniref:hypothetical protein n=1 Tax=Sphingobium sufflavum TaxID=1129547 RepID=UPI001F42E76E|nr:hypothetical protein [Sphingobium sufflavum]MCE7795154.1 hypothetical protein [Sphingobium sufflavum]
MDLEGLFLRYFGADTLEGVDADALAAGKEQLAIDFAVEQEPSRRFALWVLMEGLGIAPLPDDAFEEPALRVAANAYLDMAWKVEQREE